MLLPNYKFGFRRSHSTIHQLLTLSKEIIAKFNISKNTSTVFLEIEKAFDKLWHKGLLYKMNQLNLPNWIICLTNSYLKRRKITIKIEKNKSTYRTVKAGVPQGSVLAPLLFNLYMADLPVLQHSRISQFTDDTAIYQQSRRLNTLVRRMTSDLHQLNTWFKKCKFKINTNKTVAVYFSKKKKPPQEKITIDGTPLKWEKQANYLGITLYSKLLMKQLYPLQTSAAIYLPSPLYGCEIWTTVKENKLKIIQRSVNKVTRWAFSAPWYITNRQIKGETGMEILEETNTQKKEKLIEKQLSH